MQLEMMLPIIDPFLDDAGNAYGHIPNLDGWRQVRLNSPDFRAWLRRLVSNEIGKLATDKQVEYALEFVRGYALEQHRRDPVSNADTEVPLPVLGRVVEYIADKEGATTIAVEKLLTKCGTIATVKLKEKLPGDWPQVEDTLGIQLAALVQIMDKRGILLERNKNDRPRTWTIRRKDSASHCEVIRSVGGDDEVSGATNGVPVS